MIVAFWFASARAQDCAQPLSELEFRALVRESKEAIFRDDVLTHRRLFGELAERVPCLTGQLPKDAWAELLVSEAIVRNATGGDWQAPLATALAVFPDLAAVPEYLMEQYAPGPPARATGAPIPSDATLFVDGVLVAAVPELQGQHIVQVWRDGRWRSAWSDSAPVPAEWLIPKAPDVVTVQAGDDGASPRGRGALGVAVGFALGRQMVEDPGSYLADGRQLSGLFGIASHGVQPIVQNGGGYWDVTLPAAVPTVRSSSVEGGTVFDGSPAFLPTVDAGAAWVGRTVHAGLGAGFFGLRRVEGDRVLTAWYPQPDLRVGLRSPKADFEVAGGATPSAGHGLVRGGWSFGEPKALAVRLGFDARLGAAWLFEAPPGDRRASLLQIGLLGRIDAAWGRNG